MAHRIRLRCDDFDVIGAVPRDLSVIKNFLNRDSALKRLIDIEENFLKQCHEQRGEDTMKPGQIKLKENYTKLTLPDPCAVSATGDNSKFNNICDPCRRQKTSLVIEELTRPALTNPVYKQRGSSYFDEETVLDNSQPIKFRFRRKANNCDIEHASHLPCIPTENTNVMVLTNSADVMVWPSQKVSQMNRIPVTLLSGPGDLTEYMLEEETIM